MAQPKSFTPDGFDIGTHELAERDPVIAHLLEATGPIELPEPIDSNFVALVRAITYQQLAGAAARAIFGRLAALLGEDFTAEGLSRFAPPDLRAVGLSAAKAASVLDLSSKVIDGTVVIDDESVADQSDDDLLAGLVTVRGIGEWTAEVFMMLHLGRSDVLPVGDLGIRRGYALGWHAAIPTPKELKELGEPFRPYRSVFAWYCWRADELYGAAGASAVTGADTGPDTGADSGS